ncbi:MAG: translation initiation factor IF-2 [Candidatus Puniceispirillales bacterium]
MQVKIHWIIDGLADMEVETLEEAEAKVEDMLKKVLADNPDLINVLGARAIQGKAYLPGSEDDINDGEHEN